MAYYSGTVDDIKKTSATLGIGHGTMDDINESVVINSQKYVDSWIDTALSNIYYTPLKKITRNGVEKYPDPIPDIARRMVVADLIRNNLIDTSANVTTTADELEQESLRRIYELTSNLTGSERLDGQINKTRNRFCPPSIAPASNPVQIG